MKEPVLNRPLNTPNGKVAGTVLIPKPLNGGPPPTNLLINSRLEDQLSKGCLGGRVRWIP
jgi:hypothetical protein